MTASATARTIVNAAAPTVTPKKVRREVAIGCLYRQMPNRNRESAWLKTLSSVTQFVVNSSRIQSGARLRCGTHWQMPLGGAMDFGAKPELLTVAVSKNHYIG